MLKPLSTPLLRRLASALRYSTMTTTQPVPLSAIPAADQLVEYEGKLYTTVREGRAHILVPPNTRTAVDPKAKVKSRGGGDGSAEQKVFYNPIQQFNRDLSVLAIRAFGEDLCARRREKRGGKRKRRGGVEGGKGRKRVKGGEDGVEKDGEGKEEDDGVKVAEERDENAEQGEMGFAQPRDVRAGGVAEQRVEQDDTAQKEEQAENGVNAESTGNDAQHEEHSWKPRFRILDALSATGLRALRYASEIPFATSITANDMDRNATQSIRTNVEHNKLSSTISVNTSNAIGHMYGVAYPPEPESGPYPPNAKYDVIDLDPYGTAAPFIDSALQALNDGGMLCVTCTDSGVFASCGYSEKTYSLYGGLPIKGPHSHEGGLRLILHAIASSAAKYGMAIEPLLSLSIDFYIRVFVRVVRSPADVKFLAGKSMLVYGCDAGCGAWYPQVLGRNVRQTGKNSAEKNPTFHFKHTIAQAPSADRLCEHCGSKMHVAGPMWAGPLHNASFVTKVLADAREADGEAYATKPRIEGMLDTALEELVVLPEAETIWQSAQSNDAEHASLVKTLPEVLDPHPFFFIPSVLAKVLHCIAPPEAAVKGALRHAGFKATRSHCKPGSIKTDASWGVVWEIMREWVRQRAPVKEGALREGLVGWKVMHGGAGAKDGEEKAKLKVVFDEALGKDKDKNGKRLVRYQQNPRENWGPMARAKGSG